MKRNRYITTIPGVGGDVSLWTMKSRDLHERLISLSLKVKADRGKELKSMHRVEHMSSEIQKKQGKGNVIRQMNRVGDLGKMYK